MSRSGAKRHDPINEGTWMAAITAGVVAWLYFKASPDNPAAAAWWRFYTDTFTEWFPGWCKPTRPASAVTLGVVLVVPLMFLGIRLSEWLHITSLRSQKRRAQRTVALVEGRKPPTPGKPDRSEAGEIERAHAVFRRKWRK